MKTIFILWISAVGAEYKYENSGEYETLGPCVTEALSRGPENHAWCGPTQVITQPDGSVRPVARKEDQ